MSRPDGKNQFPDFFTTKGPIPTTVTPLKFGKRTYYQASVNSEAVEHEFNPKPYLKPYTDNDDEMVDCGDMDEAYDIVLTKSGKFSTSFYVPSSLLSYIIGAKGSKLKALQKNTSTVIKVPRMNEKGDVKILGDTERKVASARTQIAIIVAQRKDRMPPTHFISIPIYSKSICENLTKFKESVLENPPRGVIQSIFQKPAKVHLTLVVMTLLDKEEINLAKKSLENCYNEYISTLFEKNQKHKVTVRGLEIMNDDPSNVYVLYAKVQMQNPELATKLQQMADKISSYFCQAGLAKKEYDRVKLHMTVMNVSFRESNEEKMSFDAQGILEKFKDYNFGEFELKQLDLCIRGTTKSENGEAKYYDTALTVSL